MIHILINSKTGYFLSHADTFPGINVSCPANVLIIQNIYNQVLLFMLLYIVAGYPQKVPEKPVPSFHEDWSDGIKVITQLYLYQA